MLEECSGGDCFHSNRDRICDTCQVSACTLYCHTDSAYFCTSCDEHIHATNCIASRHERLLICTDCDNAPSTFNCNVDAMSLCTKCDAEIHSANLLACRHQRVPLPPTSHFFYWSSAFNLNDPTVQEADKEVSQDETDSWLLLDPGNNENQDYKDLSHCRMSDEYLDLMEHTSFTEYQYNQNQHHGDNGIDSVVPVQNMEVNEQQQQQKDQDSYVHLEHENSKATPNCTTSSSQNVPTFFLDNGIVPEATMIGIPTPYPRPPKEGINLFSSDAAVTLLQGTRINRKAKVLRYREKKKARKFEKKIRYASRKASAEIRPRVRGRFARRTDIEVEENQLFSTEELRYGIVPSFNFNQEHKK